MFNELKKMDNQIQTFITVSHFFFFFLTHAYAEIPLLHPRGVQNTHVMERATLSKGTRLTSAAQNHEGKNSALLLLHTDGENRKTWRRRKKKRN